MTDQAPNAATPTAAPTDEAPIGVKGEKVELRYTKGLPHLLHQNGLSVLISTYQAGQLIVVSAETPTKLRTAFRKFRSPMGIALNRSGLSIGTKESVWSFRNQPAVTRRLPDPDSWDGCFLPSQQRWTGDIRIHEMGYVGNELWAVNTRFSCLCTFDEDSSFVPRWRPPFISQIAGEDRCHLNGMALRKGQIAYVSALGTTDTRQGWRDNKASGGVIMSYPTGEVVVKGLSMPHSPRWHKDHLWVLNSGRGALTRVENDGRLTDVAELPGFTRGLMFVGPLAFIGLSKVRETNIFGGIPLNERVEEKLCGLWVVDTRNGKTVARMEFTGGVHEIFDVKVIKMRQPEMLMSDSPLLESAFVINDPAALKEMQAAQAAALAQQAAARESDADSAQVLSE